jgi:hypothetical protein
MKIISNRLIYTHAHALTFQRISKDELSGRSRFSIFLTSEDDVSRKSNYGLYGWELLKTRRWENSSEI